VTVAPRKATDPLPRADIVVVTWTNAEWSALDHVFVNSDSARGSGAGSWDADWLPYSHNTASYSSDSRSDPLWGTFRVVTVPGVTQDWTVILYRSNAHLQYSPYIAGLRAEVNAIISDAQPKYLYSIGTAGGGNLQQMLGDAVLTNGAQLLPGAPPNNQDPENGATFTCSNWFPSSTLFASAQQLMFPLASVATQQDLETVFSQFSRKNKVGNITLTDLINGPLNPANLGSPSIHSMQGTPLNTSCNFAMAPGEGSTAFSAYEEDDAVLGEVALSGGVNFAFMRNVSDPVVPDKAGDGTAISTKLRQQWASALYERYGLFTASNGALATWAVIGAS
ncbi:MAG: GTPase, partial [Caballeronia sp.]